MGGCKLIYNKWLINLINLKHILPWHWTEIHQWRLIHFHLYQTTGTLSGNLPRPSPAQCRGYLCWTLRNLVAWNHRHLSSETSWKQNPCSMRDQNVTEHESWEVRDARYWNEVLSTERVIFFNWKYEVVL